MKVKLIGSPWRFDPPGEEPVWLLEAEDASGSRFFFLGRTQEDLQALETGEELRIKRTNQGNYWVKRVRTIELPDPE